MNMDLDKLFKENDTLVSYKVLLENGYTKYQIKKMVENKSIVKVCRGFYSLYNDLVDEFYSCQLNNSFMIYSNETALYLHNLTDRFPSTLSITTKTGYHIRNKDLKVYYTAPDALDIGMIEISSPQGNMIKVYDKERTICDIIKHKNRIDPQVYVQGLQSYFLNGDPDFRKLSKYSKLLNIQSKVMDIIELYMRP
ncbi:MAG: hypothetical protein E7191_07785 [Erysipelotrichaceae bacterium]|nr:hypothetical protein [Erysipelotrichaceae bacterium]